MPVSDLVGLDWGPSEPVPPGCGLELPIQEYTLRTTGLELSRWSQETSFVPRGPLCPCVTSASCLTSVPQFAYL